MQGFIKQQVLTPIGTIIQFMGNTPPEGYLFCDGSLYEEKDYPEFVQFLKDQFGSSTYFGGDGLFAVPDCRESFLKCAEDSGVMQEAGLPNATGHFTTYTWDTILTQWPNNAFTKVVLNPSGTSGSNTKTEWIRLDFSLNNSNKIYGASDTVTPKNWSVKFCIKVKYYI